MNMEFLKRNKRVFLISLGIIVVALLFFLKSSSVFRGASTVERAGLVYNNETLNDLVSRDTDGDGVLDWEEGLWGTDPKNPDTFGHGLGDAAEIAKMKQALGQNSTSAAPQEKLTETDKFSRELFTTVTALTQTGGLDQDTVNKLNASVIDQISNPSVKTAFGISDIKTTSDAGTATIKKYSDALDIIFKKNPALFAEGYDGVVYEIGKRFATVMQAFQTDENADTSVLIKLQPIISQVETIEDGMKKMNTPVPQQFAGLHLSVINGFQMILENLQGLKIAEEDPIVAMGAANKLPDNMEALQSNLSKLKRAIDSKLK